VQLVFCRDGWCQPVSGLTIVEAADQAGGLLRMAKGSRWSGDGSGSG